MKSIEININNNIEMYSFDIFDTLVTRRVATPKGIFVLVQKILEKESIPEILKNNFYTIRIEAEEYAREICFRNTNSSEITFDEIYNYIALNYNLTVEQLNLLKRIEVETEIKNLVPINENIEKIKKLMMEDKHIVLISDMYFGAKELKFILSHVDSIFSNIVIYSSSDYKESKYNSNLYKIVKQKEGITNYKKWKHIGDNLYSDIKIAKGLGIITHHYPQIKYANYEKQSIKENESDITTQVMIGTAKLARMCNENIVFGFGASFVGPIVYNYVRYILDQAISRNFKTLYFVARDGYILKLVADRIIESKNLSIKTKYIYGSRKAWRVISENDTVGYERLIKSIFLEYPNKVNVKFLAYRLDTTVDYIKSIFGIKTNKILNLRTRKDLIKKALSDNYIKDEIINLYLSKYNLTKEYFEQELDFTESNIAFVDLYGSGKTQDFVAKIINEINPKVKFYSFYITNGMSENIIEPNKLAYLSSKKYKGNWVELFSRTIEGQTIGYERNNGKIVPVLKKVTLTEKDKTFVEDYNNGILLFSSYLSNFEDINSININSINVYCNFYKYFMNNLDKQTAQIISKINYSDIGNRNSHISHSPKISVFVIVFYWIIGKKIESISDFPMVSISHSSCIVQVLYKFIKKYPTLQKFLLDIYVHKKVNIAYICVLGIKFHIEKMLWRSV